MVTTVATAAWGWRGHLAVAKASVTEVAALNQVVVVAAADAWAAAVSTQHVAASQPATAVAQSAQAADSKAVTSTADLVVAASASVAE